MIQLLSNLMHGDGTVHTRQRVLQIIASDLAPIVQSTGRISALYDHTDFATYGSKLIKRRKKKIE